MELNFFIISCNNIAVHLFLVFLPSAALQNIYFSQNRVKESTEMLDCFQHLLERLFRALLPLVIGKVL